MIPLCRNTCLGEAVLNVSVFYYLKFAIGCFAGKFWKQNMDLLSIPKQVDFYWCDRFKKNRVTMIQIITYHNQEMVITLKLDVCIFTIWLLQSFLFKNRVKPVSPYNIIKENYSYNCPTQFFPNSLRIWMSQDDAGWRDGVWQGFDSALSDVFDVIKVFGFVVLNTKGVFAVK